MFWIIPECPECKSTKDVVFKTADVYDEKTWFHICYCKKCYSVIECHFSGRMMSKKESQELNKELVKQRNKRLKGKWY